MGQNQEKFAKKSPDVSINDKLRNGFEERNNNLSSGSCLKNSEHVAPHSPRKYRVTFDPSSKYKEESVVSPSTPPEQHLMKTLTIQPKERLIDSGVKKDNGVRGGTSIGQTAGRQSAESYRQSLRSACRGEGQIDLRSPRSHTDYPAERKFNGYGEGTNTSRVSSTRQSDTRASDKRASDTRASDTRASDKRALDTRASDKRALDTRASDMRASDKRALDTRASDMRASDKRASDKRASDKRASSTRASDRRALGSFASTYQVSDEVVGKWSSSDHSFWSSDYSTSAGGTSDKSNDSNESNVCQRGNTDLTKYTPIQLKHKESSSKTTTGVISLKRESLQERLRKRVSIFENEHLVRKKVSEFNSLPEHILLTIFSYLSTPYLCRASGVCRKWQSLCWDPLLWKTMLISKYPASDIDKVLYTILTRLANNTQGLCLTLQHITLLQCECLSDRGLDYIARYCIDLVRLEIIGCPCIMSRGVQAVLENCLRLTYLDVRGSSCVNGICYNMITNIKSSDNTFFQVKYLDMSDCVAVDDLGLRALGLTCQMLETLHMRRCPRITDVGMQHIASHCTRLKELSVSDCHKVRDFSLKEIAKYCTSLRYLSLMRCAVTDSGIKVIGRGCNNLRYLNVRGCTAVTDVGVIHIAQNCLKLRSLDAGKCDITNNSLSALGIHCPQLKRLSIKGCVKLTDVGIRAVVAQCCLLHYLNVEDCSITLDTYEFIREHCQSCVIEHTSLDI